MNRRDFLARSLLTTAALAAGPALSGQPRASAGTDSGSPGIIDTNVHLFDWPFRRLKYGETSALVAKLRKHRVRQAWAGSFEGQLHKDVAGVNQRLAEECRAKGEGLLLPFGTVNPMWPDWEEDLRRCHEEYQMPGIRLHPPYQNYRLDHPEFARLVRMAAERGLIVQIAIEMEDARVHHPTLHAPTSDVAPLVPLLQELPQAKVQILHVGVALFSARFKGLIEQTNSSFDISGLESNGGVGRIIEGKSWGRAPAAKLPLERILFGSHAPYFPLESALLKLMESPLTRPQLDAVMFANAERLLASG